MRRALLVLATASALAGGAAMAAPANAEAPGKGVPACGSKTQIGSKGYVRASDGTIVATVRQYKGCGRNWAHVYAWESYRDNASQWDMRVAVAVTDSQGHPRKYVGERGSGWGRTVWMWSHGTDTYSVCTRAVAAVTEPNSDALTAPGYSSTVC